MLKNLWEKYSYVIILIAISYIAIFAFFYRLEKPEDFLQVTVSEGESLWEIAERYSDSHSMSTTQFVKWVEENNGIFEGKIFPGDQLKLPVHLDDYRDTDVVVLAGEQ